MKRMMMFALAALLWSGAACAHDYKIGQLSIAHPWTRATPKGARVAGGYLTITNMGNTADKLIGGTFELAGRLEIHQMRMDGGVMTMRPLDGGLELKPNAQVELKPGSLHFMFVDLKRPLEQGQRIKATLIFEKAGTIEVEFVVEAMGATPSHHHKH
jgi:copper(I)-binding protein